MAGISLSNSAFNNLTKINLSSSSISKLSGTIDVSEFKNLTEFSCISTGITEFTAVKSLEEVTLKKNGIQSYPLINNLTSLRKFIIDGEFRLPSFLPSLSANTILEDFRVDNCNLSGAFPSLSTCPALSSLSLRNNSLTGTIPPFTHNTNLLEFGIDYNNFSGNFPSLTSCPSLSSLAIRNNSFSGNIPPISSLPLLEFADFRNNSFVGNLPILSANHNLRQFYSNGNNSLSGLLPPLSTSVLNNINITKNNLSGSPHDFHTTPELKTYHAFQNELTGLLPAFSACPGLITIDFNENFFEGSVPFINNLSNLKIFNVNNNALTGFFPETNSLSALQFLRFNQNIRLGVKGLSGDIPDLSASSNLNTLDAASNSLTGWAGTVWPSSLSGQNIQIQNNFLTTATVNTLLSALCATGALSGTLQVGGSNNSPTNGSSNFQKLALEGRGWTVGI
jgi:Leucine-rich repeat (LRR) protein